MNDRVHVDVAEAARPQVARHAPAAPIERRRVLGSDDRVAERGVDPDAEHRRLLDVLGVVAPEPPPQGALAGGRVERRDVGDLREGLPTARSACAARTRASSPLFRKYR